MDLVWLMLGIQNLTLVNLGTLSLIIRFLGITEFCLGFGSLGNLR